MQCMAYVAINIFNFNWSYMTQMNYRAQSFLKNFNLNNKNTLIVSSAIINVYV